MWQVQDSSTPCMYRPHEEVLLVPPDYTQLVRQETSVQDFFAHFIQYWLCCSLKLLNIVSRPVEQLVTRTTPKARRI
jgi:hypothetical protein